MPSLLAISLCVCQAYSLGKHTFESNFVAFHALDRLLEEGLVSSRVPRHVILLPFNWCVDMLENLLDGVCYLCTDAIPRYLRMMMTTFSQEDKNKTTHQGNDIDATVFARELQRRT